MAKPQGGIEVEGAKEFRKAMKGFVSNLEDLTAIHKRAAEMVLREARTLVPVLSGDLKDTLAARGTTKKAYIKAGSRAVPYAGPIHFGWPARNIKPQPFIYEALDERKADVLNAYEAHIEALVLKVARETPP